MDAAIYFWLPQINVTILRLIQRRNLRHRMVCRTVVIGDIPWVAQCAEAFLSKVSRSNNEKRMLPSWFLLLSAFLESFLHVHIVLQDSMY